MTQSPLDGHEAAQSPDDAGEVHSTAFTGVVVPYDDAPDELTIYPTDATDEELLTTWVSAQEDSYVDLSEMA